jgi:hypothetical protein
MTLPLREIIEDEAGLGIAELPDESPGAAAISA